MPTKRKVPTLAERIAHDLFTYASTGKHRVIARRLVLETAESLDGSGWSERAVADLIERHLKEHLRALVGEG